MADVWPDEHPFSQCAHCGAGFEPEVNYPVVTRGGGAEQLELYSFCDDECMRAWADGD